MTAQEYLAKIFRTDPKIISKMEQDMNKITGRKGIVDDLMRENKKRIARTLNALNVREYKAEDVFRALITRLQKDDREIFALFQRPSGTTNEGLQTLFNFAKELAELKPLVVLKKRKAEEILRNNPPQRIIKALQYKDVDELLEKEDLIEIFCALRFVETKDWMHNTFDKEYKKLAPEDFEERNVDVRVLSGKWLKIAEEFVEKKYHNISHLKEMGVVFVIPLKIESPGETLRLFSLILHYLHELDFYSKLFSKAAHKDNFGENIISLLKGEVIKEEKQSKETRWLIVQRYLAKENKDDPRLFLPHVNPEALHWQKAEKDIANLGDRFANIQLEMWLDLDWVGGFFQTKDKSEMLVSFDLVDNVMALVKKEEEIKYLYHHQEALWNQIFEEYMGVENLEKLMIENFEKGFIPLT
ncbi:MAG: hypothetical protein GF387_00935 [Candidatus Portnoybacteria bacterium]|nr:hypothetical protein [Candidatus Portnoybacteria bacterium]